MITVDPVSLVTGAMFAGASSALKDTTSQALKDGYNKLKTLVGKRIASKPDAQAILVQFEKDPKLQHAYHL